MMNSVPGFQSRSLIPFLFLGKGLPALLSGQMSLWEIHKKSASLQFLSGEYLFSGFYAQGKYHPVFIHKKNKE